MLDPMERWREYGEKPDYAGPLTFGGVPCTLDAAELAGVDVATVDAPARRGRTRRPAALRADRIARVLAGRGRIRVAGRARDHEPVHARRSRSGDPRGRAPDDRDPRRRPRVPDRRHRRARPGVHPRRYRDPGAGRDDV